MTLRLGADDGQVAALRAWRILTAGLKMLEHTPKGLQHRQHGRCYLCGDRWTPTGRLPNWRQDRTRDHVFPRRTGGGGYSNILLAHDGCNQTKGDRWPYPCEVIYLAAMYLPPVPRRRLAA